MGYVPLTQVTDIYTQIRRQATGRTCSVLIFVAATIDGLCALRILTVLLLVIIIIK